MKKKLVIVGGGTAALFLAAFLDTSLYEVSIFEKKASLGRKFLVAGDGGFNLTHSEDLATFKSRYTPPQFLDNALEYFSNEQLRSFLQELGIPTFMGSSGRVFPERGIKPIEVLKAMEQYLLARGVQFQFNKTFSAWGDENELIFNKKEKLQADYVVFALGGASWKVTGSDGAWLDVFAERGIETTAFQASNCAFKVEWAPAFIEKNEGKPLKNISISCNGKTQKGEAVVTKFGIEGNAIYGLSPEIRAALNARSAAKIYIDFKTTLSQDGLVEKLQNSKFNLSTALVKDIKLPRVAVELIKANLGKDEFLDILTLAKAIKFFPIIIVGLAPIDEAISTVGGISQNAINQNFELKVLNNTFCIGEMLDWDAPTGGYLIQACASMGVYLANFLNKN